MDWQLLAAVKDREAYGKWASFIKPQALTADAWSVLTALGEWWDQQAEWIDELDGPQFLAWYTLVRHAKMDKDRMAVHRSLIEQMTNYEHGEEVEVILQSLMKRDYASRIAEHALRITDGDYALHLEAVEDMVQEWRQESGRAASLDGRMGSFTIEALESVAGPGLQWRLPGLNLAAGPVRKGDLVVFQKRPDAGGTTFLASEATFMAPQMEDDAIVLWFNNEESGNKVRRRIVQAALGWTREEMELDWKRTMREYASLMGHPDKIVVYDDSKLTFKQAERLLRELKPGLIIADQLWKFKGGPHMEGTESMTYSFNWAREVAKDYGAVIAVHQMGVEGENKRYVGYEGLYGTKTGGPGEADLIISMGRRIDDGDMRYFYLPKNKMLTPEDETKRNMKWEAVIDTQRARIYEPRT